MGAIVAAVAWVVLIGLIVFQLVFNKIVNSIPTSHLLGWGPALTGVLVPFELAFDILVGLFATILTIFSFVDTRRDSGRRVGQ